ncbi:MAG: nuclear transport factor 2 family protein [Solirubrobacteraceae bacterium]
MPLDNVEIVSRLYEAWGHQDFPGPLELLDPEVEYVNPPGAVEPGVRRGIEAFSDAALKVLDGWEWWNMEPERFTPHGDQVAVVVRYSARGRTSGLEVEGIESALFTLRGGKLIRYEWFHGADDAERALGRSP